MVTLIIHRHDQQKNGFDFKDTFTAKIRDIKI